MGLAIETPLLVEENSASHQHILAFATLAKTNQNPQAVTDFLITQGAHREAFLGAIELIKAGILPRTPQDANANSGENEHWAHYLARFGAEPMDEALIDPQQLPISLADRFEALNQAGMAFNDADTTLPSPLLLAVEHGNNPTLCALAGIGANVNAANQYGSTPLHSAANGGHAEAIAILIGHGANVDAADQAGNTPLHIAAYGGHAEAITTLIKHGANVNAANFSRCTGDTILNTVPGAYERIRGDAPLHVAATRGHAGAIAELIRLGANVNAANQYGSTPLHSAANGGHAEAIAILIGHGANVDAADQRGNTPLHIVTSYSYSGSNREVAIRTLVGLGANMNATDEDGETPLHEAASGGHAGAVAELIRLGANVNARNNKAGSMYFGSTPLLCAALRNQENEAVIRTLVEHGADLAVVHTANGDGIPWLCYASYCDQRNVITNLVKCGADVNAVDNSGLTPLHSASAGHGAEAIRTLVGLGANVNASSQNGITPLHKTVEDEDTRMDAITTLIDLGADVNAFDDTGSTPLHWAASSGLNDSITTLIDYGKANVNAVNQFGRTPLHEAAKYRRKETIVTLVENGGRVLANDQAAIDTILDALQQALNPPRKRQRVDGPN